MLVHMHPNPNFLASPSLAMARPATSFPSPVRSVPRLANDVAASRVVPVGGEVYSIIFLVSDVSSLSVPVTGLGQRPSSRMCFCANGRTRRQIGIALRNLLMSEDESAHVCNANYGPELRIPAQSPLLPCGLQPCLCLSPTAYLHSPPLPPLEKKELRRYS
jgi:hypothetical protein